MYLITRLVKNKKLKSKLIIIEQYFYPEGWSGAQITRDIAIYCI